MPKTSLSKAQPVEIVSASWDICRQHVSNIKLHFRLAVLHQVMAGFELAALKKELGFTGSGRRKEKAHDGPFRSWEQWCKDELDLGESTVERWIDMAEVVKPRIKKLPGNVKLLSIAETSPGKLDAIQRQTLEALVAKVTDGDTQKDLLEELKLVKLHTTLPGGDTSKHPRKGKDTLSQLTLKFFTPLSDDINAIAIHPQRDAMFAHLAADAPEKLHEMEHALTTTLEAIRAAKARRVHPKQPAA